MKIVMVTNNFAPQRDGIARSVTQLTEQLRRLGHQVLVIAPEGDGAETENDAGKLDEARGDQILVHRIPAVQKYDGTDYSATVQLSDSDYQKLDAFGPDLVHSHHPFLLGAAAARIAARYKVPLVFSHHAMFKHSARYADATALSRYVAHLTIGYCNLADAVIVPSKSVASILRSRGVNTLVAVAPMGIDVDRFARGDGGRFRRQCKIPESAFVVGYVGRLTADKNVRFLTASFIEFLRRHPRSHVVVVGDGPERDTMESALRNYGQAGRVHFTGELEGDQLADAYAALNVFAYASRTDTQGSSVVEALAAGVPVVALDAPWPRDVVRDRENGRLLPAPSRRAFAAALQEFASISASELERYRAAARAVAKRFALEDCTELVLAVYQQHRDAPRRHREIDASSWEKARRRLEVELQLWMNRASATSSMWAGSGKRWRFSPLQRIVDMFRRFRTWASRREWSVRFLNLPVSEGTADEPGLVLLQIDGLSRDQIEQELERGHMPFLQGLIERESYRIETMYSGLPSTTPAVLGELFYGVEQAVPAFGFRDHRSGEVLQMWNPTIASQIQTELAQQGEGLLADGCAYCVPYSGGASHSNVCPATMGWQILEDAGMWRRLMVFLLNAMSLIRLVGHSCVELVIAIYDTVKGIHRRPQLLQELLYIPRRVIVNIALREALSIFAEVDATCGARVIHVNFVGYDENAHRRGPQSLFAHYALRGIDRALRRIWDAAQCSARRDYQVWILSDHGQERVVPYSQFYGRTLTSAVHELFLSTRSPGTESASQTTAEPKKSSEEDPHEPTTVAIGPLGYIYWPEQLAPQDIEQIAPRLVAEVGVPLVLAKVDESVFAWTERGRFEMPDEAEQVLAPNHPHMPEVAHDLTKLCSHPDAGEFVICGWRNDQLPLSFVTENGAHAGPGPRETTGFVMVPPQAPPADRRSGIFRPNTLRRMAQEALGHTPQEEPENENFREHPVVRIVSYNVHECVGLDGSFSPSRIARVLAATGPDVIALQEVGGIDGQDGSVNQLEVIARSLEQELHSDSKWQVVTGCCGCAVLSRLPAQQISAEKFPRRRGSRNSFGAMAVEIDVHGFPLHLINTQLSPRTAEQIAQIEQLCASDGLPGDDRDIALVWCGDFRAQAGSKVYQRIPDRLREAQLAHDEYRPSNWFKPRSLSKTPCIFVDGSLNVTGIEVRATRLSRIASDHLPVVVDVEIRQRLEAEGRRPEEKTEDPTPERGRRTEEIVG